MLRPTPKEKQITINEDEEEGQSLRERQKRLQRVDNVKDKIRILIETPLFFNAELLK
jgi:hypothetical protein